MRADKYILDGHTPIPCEDTQEWGRWYEKNVEQRRVGLTDLENGVRVSTVFLGLDHQWGDGPPLLFETLVFEGMNDEYMERCSTWDEAVEQHKRIVSAQENQIVPREFKPDAGSDLLVGAAAAITEGLFDSSSSDDDKPSDDTFTGGGGESAGGGSSGEW